MVNEPDSLLIHLIGLSTDSILENDLVPVNITRFQPLLLCHLQ